LGWEDSVKGLEAFYSQQNSIDFDIDTINIFLAGNSSKSPIVKELFEKNIKDNNISFKYYLGTNRRRKFRVKIDRDRPYNQWIEFIDASQESFEIYYTSSPLASKNSLPITDNSIKKIRLNISKVDEDLSIFIRLIDSTTLEYGVGSSVDDVDDIIQILI